MSSIGKNLVHEDQMIKALVVYLEEILEEMGKTGVRMNLEQMVLTVENQEQMGKVLAVEEMGTTVVRMNLEQMVPTVENQEQMGKDQAVEEMGTTVVRINLEQMVLTVENQEQMGKVLAVEEVRKTVMGLNQEQMGKFLAVKEMGKTVMNQNQEIMSASQDAPQNAMSKETSREKWRVNTMQRREGRGRLTTDCPAM